jgi:hypothetical protein
MRQEYDLAPMGRVLMLTAMSAVALLLIVPQLSSAASPFERRLSEILENTATPQAAGIARQLRAIKPTWNFYGDDLDEIAEIWCTLSPAEARKRLLNKLWRPDARAFPAFTQLVRFLLDSCLKRSNVDAEIAYREANRTAEALTTRIFREIDRQQRAQQLSWTRPAPQVSQDQVAFFQAAASSTCDVGSVATAAWISKRLKGAQAFLALVTLGVAKRYCPSVIGQVAP